MYSHSGGRDLGVCQISASPASIRMRSRIFEFYHEFVLYFYSKYMKNGIQSEFFFQALDRYLAECRVVFRVIKRRQLARVRFLARPYVRAAVLKYR